jgi:hypothetical protein
MAPFWSGIAIGLLLSAALFVIVGAALALYIVILATAAFVRSGVVAMRKGRQDWRAAAPERQAKAIEIRARIAAHHERQRAWLERHGVPSAWASFLTRPVFRS